MGFLSGSLTFARFEITKDDSGEFGDSHLKTLAKRQIGSKQVDLLEEPSIGFTGGTHVFDTDLVKKKTLSVKHCISASGSTPSPSPETSNERGCKWSSTAS